MEDAKHVIEPSKETSSLIDNSQGGRRIAKNTGLLYTRMAIVMVINLYTVRIVLNALGLEDYGIYDVVAGIVVLFQSVSSVLSSSVQRFYSYALGERNDKKFRQIFSESINVYVVLSFLVFVICETIGLWFLNTYLDIPTGRLVAANWIFQFSVISFILAIMQTPFLSAIIAYEDMGAFAIISMAECVLKFLSVLFISYVLVDRLILYGFFLLIISCLVFVSYLSFGLCKYRNCRYSRKHSYYWREILVFSGWTFLGSAAGVGMNQICTIFVNIFFGPVTNAARAIAFQMYNAINSLCSSFLMAVRPPMIKAYAENQFDYLNKLLNYSTKFVYFTLLMLFLPLLFEMEYILKLWLNVSDNQTMLFARLMLIYSFILALSNPITFIIHASGNVKQYHLSVEIPTLAVIPLTYLTYALGSPAYSTYVVMIVAVLISHVIRLFCLHYFYPQYNVFNYLNIFLFRLLPVTIVVAIFLAFVYVSFYDGFVRLSLEVMSSIFFTCIVTYFIGLDSQEKIMIRQLTHNLIMRCRFSK